MTGHSLSGPTDDNPRRTPGDRLLPDDSALLPARPDSPAHAWLLDGFARRTPGVRHAVSVSASGLARASSSRLLRGDADRLAALTVAVLSCATATAQLTGGTTTLRAAMELDTGILLLTPLSPTVTLTVLTDSEADLDHIGYEVAVLGERLLDSLFDDDAELAQVRVIR